MKKFDNLTVRELLHIEDGYYKLENPITYTIGGGEEKEPLVHVTIPITHRDTHIAIDATEIDGSVDNPTQFVPQLKVTYHVKAQFETGVVCEGDIETDGDGNEMNLDFHEIMEDADSYLWTKVTFTENNIKTQFGTKTKAAENQKKYGNSYTLTITESDDGSTSGEISGVISLDTKTNSTDGILKVITTMSDDVSYYVDNIWQDGDVLIISFKDEGSDSGDGGGGITFVDVDYSSTGTPTLDITAGELISLLQNGDVWVNFKDTTKNRIVSWSDQAPEPNKYVFVCARINMGDTPNGAFEVWKCNDASEQPHC